MRAFILGLVTLGVNLAYWLHYRSIDFLRDYSFLRDYDITKDLVLLVLSVVLLADGIYDLRNERRSKRETKERELRERETLEQELEELHEARAALEQLEQANALLQNDKRQLQLALDDSTDRVTQLQAALESTAMEKAKHASAARRDDLVDAEIVHFLSLLQERGRFVDFLMDDITRYQDAQVGAAARVVHQGCKAVLEEYFSIAPVFSGEEGAAIKIEREYDPQQYRIVGRVLGAPPFQGRVLHRGWRTRQITLPRLLGTGEAVQKVDVIAPVEVELN